MLFALVAAVLLLEAGRTVALPPGVRRAWLYVFASLFFVVLLGVVAFSYLLLTAGPPEVLETLGGLLARLAARIAAYTCAQQPNDRLARPPHYRADLMV